MFKNEQLGENTVGNKVSAVLDAATVAIALGEYAAGTWGLEIPYFFPNPDDTIPEDIEELKEKISQLSEEVDVLIDLSEQAISMLAEIENITSRIQAQVLWNEVSGPLNEAENHIDIAFEQMTDSTGMSSIEQWDQETWYAYVTDEVTGIDANLSTLHDLLTGKYGAINESVTSRWITVLQQVADDLPQSMRYSAYLFWNALLEKYMRGLAVLSAKDVIALAQGDGAELTDANVQNAIQSLTDNSKSDINAVREQAVTDLAAANIFWHQSGTSNEIELDLDSVPGDYVFDAAQDETEGDAPEDGKRIIVNLGWQGSDSDARLGGETLPVDQVFNGTTWRQEHGDNVYESVHSESEMIWFNIHRITTNPVMLDSGYVLTRLKVNAGIVGDEREDGLLMLVAYGRKLEIDAEGDAKLVGDEVRFRGNPLHTRYLEEISDGVSIKKVQSAQEPQAPIIGVRFQKEGKSIYVSTVTAHPNDPMFMAA